MLFYQILLLPQVKQSGVISNKSCWTADDLASWEIGKYQGYLKISWKFNLVSSLPPKIKILSLLAKNYWKIEVELSSLCPILHEIESFTKIYLSVTVGFQLKVLLALLTKVTLFICTNRANLLSYAKSDRLVVIAKEYS